VDEAAEEIVAFDRRGAWWIGSVDRFGRPKAACSMRASAVVASRVGAEHVFEMSATDDQQPVETLGADGADEALGIGVCLWRTDRRLDDIDALAAEDLVKRGLNLLSRSWIRKRVRSRMPVKLRLRACCVTQAPVGLGVQPAIWTRRLPSSMKKRT
jgi:hypothetical protein